MSWHERLCKILKTAILECWNVANLKSMKHLFFISRQRQSTPLKMHWLQKFQSTVNSFMFQNKNCRRQGRREEQIMRLLFSISSLISCANSIKTPQVFSPLNNPKQIPIISRQMVHACVQMVSHTRKTTSSLSMAFTKKRFPMFAYLQNVPLNELC